MIDYNEIGRVVGKEVYVLYHRPDKRESLVRTPVVIVAQRNVG